MLGLTAAEWRAIGTIALVAVTIAYVIFTGKLARQASQTTKLAERSAHSAEEAARAAERAARVAEAGLNVDFEANLEEVEETTPERWIVINSLGARVYVHGASVQGIYHTAESVAFLSHELSILHPQEEPVLLHRNEQVVMEWPGGPIDLSKPTSAVVEIRFSIDMDDEPSTIRRVLSFPALGYQQ